MLAKINQYESLPNLQSPRYSIKWTSLVGCKVYSKMQTLSSTGFKDKALFYITTVAHLILVFLVMVWQAIGLDLSCSTA